MVLNTDEPGMIFQLDHFHQFRIGIHTNRFHTSLFELMKVFVVEFIAMAMTLMYNSVSINRIRLRALLEFTGIRSKTHRSAFCCNLLLFLHHVDDRSEEHTSELQSR